LLIISCTSKHDHPNPIVLSTTNSAQQSKEPETIKDLPVTSNEEDQEHIVEEMINNKSIVTSTDQVTNDENFHYLQSPIHCSEEIIIDQENPFKLNIEKNHIDKIYILLEEDPLCYA
jgi:hypothetical protein